jgi:Dyp-type peroxidase family
MATSSAQTPPSPFREGDLDSIQGIGIAGFKKDHQELIFVTFGAPPASKALVKALRHRISHAAEVGDFNEDFSEALHQHGQDPDLTALWVGIGISASGLEKLGASLDELPAGAGRDAFRAGMAARNTAIGDSGPNDPTHWLPPFRTRGGVDAVIVVAGDEPTDVDRVVDEIAEAVTHHEGTVVFQERGATLIGEMRGHEHFGFKDGASQPAIVGYDTGPGPQEPPAVPAGEFVLGYPDGAAVIAQVEETWRNGSFLVFRRLLQDVFAFRSITKIPVPGADPQLDDKQLAAKMVGRWPSGAPLEKYPDGDPGAGHNDNDFEYLTTDDQGLVVPTWAHIRKANPRDESQPPTVTADDDSGRHRMLRRGAPFGPELASDAHQDDGQERGLHFIAVIADLARQFEFVQLNWIDNENFPKGSKPGTAGGPYSPPSPAIRGDGPDPVVGEGNTNKVLQLHQPLGVRGITLTGDVVRVSAGEYFFCPALAALDLLSG